MDVFAIVLLIVLFFVLMFVKSSIVNKIERLENEINQLRESLAKSMVARPPAATQEPVAPVVPPKKDPGKKEYWETAFRVEEAINAPEPEEKQPVVRESIVIANRPSAQPATPAPPPPPRPSFFERHPDLEKFIGENLINKIGIAILVLAIGFFVKYAIDNNWIGDIGRVAIGILCGGILIFFAHRLRRNYHSFSSVLVGGGLAIFYFTISLAYHQFHLFGPDGQTVAFVIMVVITGFAVLLSLLYDRQELAVIALVGGFVAPFLVSNGSGNYKALFSYLLVLNTGLLIMAYNKAWRILNIVAFVLTAALMWTWLATLGDKIPYDTWRNGLLFATAFYLLFFGVNIANNIKENKRFIASDFGILLANTALYFAVGLYFLDGMHADNYRGLFTAAMGVFNLGASFLLFRRQRVDRNVLYLLTGITLTFVSLAAPIQLHGHYITLFWASECVLLYWLYQRSAIGIIRISSMIVWTAMLVSLLMDWLNIYLYSPGALPIVFNKGFITSVYTAVASYGLFLLKKKEVEPAGKVYRLLPGAVFFRISALVLLFTAGALEINHQFLYYYPSIALNIQYLLLYSVAFVALFYFINTKRPPSASTDRIASVLLLACLLGYLVSIEASDRLLHDMLNQDKYLVHFYAHWIVTLLMGLLFYYSVSLTRKTMGESKQLPLACWLLCAWVVNFVSTEAGLLIERLYYTNAASWDIVGDVYVKTGLPIIWGLCSFAFMWLGMRYKFRPLRIVSLTLFSITLVKLFVYDIRTIPVGGKIAAFFCLGVLLLVVSFMYQRLKRIIIEDEKKNSQ